MKLNNKLKILFTNFFYALQKEKVQKKIKVFNSILAFISLAIIFTTLSSGGYVYSFKIISFKTLFVGSLFYFTNLYLWHLFMKHNYQLEIEDFIKNWSLSKVGKYIPAGVMILTSRLNQKVKRNQNTKKILYGLLEEQFLFSIIGVIISLLVISFFSNPYQPIVFFIFSILLVNLIQKIIEKFEFDYTNLFNNKIVAVLNINLNMLLIYLIALDVSPEISFQIAIFYFLSTCLSLFFIGAPAGIGVREFIFLFFVNSETLNYSEYDFLFTMRLVIILLDLGAYLFSLIFLKYRKTFNN